MKTLIEQDIENVREKRDELVQRMDQIIGLIDAGRALNYAEHVHGFGALSHSFDQSIRRLAPSPPAPPEQESALQQLAQRVIEQYVDDNELNPVLLEGETELMTAKLHETEQVWRSGSAEFTLPEALLENHRDGVIEAMSEALYEEFHEGVVDLEDYDGEVTDNGVEIK